MNRSRLLWIKTGLHLLCGLPLLYLFLAVQSGAAGGDPVQYVIHFLGMGILNTLVVTLLVSPVAKWRQWPWLIRVRRLLGLWCFAYAVLHLGAFIVFDLLSDISLLLGEIVKRPYITVGMVAFVVLLLLAITSTQAMQRRLGKRWSQLHKWVYLVAILGPIHFWWSVKSGNLEPALYMLGFVLLLSLRLGPKGGLRKEGQRLAKLWRPQADTRG